MQLLPKQAVCLLAIKRGCFYTSLLQLVTVLCLPSARILHIHPELYFPLYLGCDFALLIHLWHLPGFQVSLSGCRASQIKEIPWTQEIFWMEGSLS